MEDDNFLKCHFFIKVANKNLQRSCALFFSSLALILRTLFPSELVGAREKEENTLSAAVLAPWQRRRAGG